MQLSLTAYRIAPTPEARGSLLRASTLHAATRILGNAGAVNAVAISPDGHTLAAGSDDQAVNPPANCGVKGYRSRQTPSHLG